MAILETILDNIGTAGQITADFAKKTAESLVLMDQIRRDRKEIRKLTYEIGKTYMRLHQDDYEEEYREFYEKIAAANSDIKVKSEKLDQLKVVPEGPEEAEDEYDDEEEWDDFFGDSDEAEAEKPVKDSSPEEAADEDAVEQAAAAEETAEAARKADPAAQE